MLTGPGIKPAAASSVRHVARAALVSLKQLVKVSPLGSLLLPRRIHVYCVGPPKSGTVSAWGMFSAGYRSGHEAARDEVVELMISRFAGQLTKQAAIRRLRKRDRALRLEMDSFGLLAMFTEELATTFPSARFLLTVREPRAWLNSIINQHLNVDVSNRPSDRLLRQLIYGPPGATYSGGEDELERRGLFPLSGYLKGWSTHYKWVLDVALGQRVLTIETEALSSSVGELAAFLSIAPKSIDIKRTHLHRAPRDHGVVSRLPPGLVEDKIESHCGEILAQVTALLGAPEAGPAAAHSVTGDRC